MKETGLIFQGWGVRAIIAGTKTQTRRVVKPQPPAHCTYLCKAINGWAWTDGSTIDYDYFPKDREALVCPYGVPGDRLWVRETFALQCNCDCENPPFDDGRPIKRTVEGEWGERWWQPHYQATDPPPALCCESPRCKCCSEGEPGPHWKPSIHMPRWASRLLLEITDVRVQRVQDITEEDAKAEGMIGSPLNGKVWHRENFSGSWDAINAKRGFGWDVNPWVWALTFRKMDPT